MAGVVILFDGARLARAWLSVAVASGADKDRPALHRTVAIESFPTGVRLVATDGWMLLHAWVPTVDDHDAEVPDVDEAPDATAVAMDPDGRAKGFCGYVRKLAAKAVKGEGEFPKVTMDLGVIIEEEDDRPGFAGMEPTWAVLDLAGTERIQLQLYEGPYPNWRALLVGFEPVSTTTIALAPELIGRVSKLGTINGEFPVGWTFGGPSKAARIIAPLLVNGEHDELGICVEGLVMPCRWDVERNAPAEEQHEDGDS